MSRVWPIAELDGRDILAEWLLNHAVDGHMLIRLWDGNQDVHVYIDDDPRKLGGHPNNADSYGNGYRQVVTEVIPCFVAAGWVVTESEVAPGIDAEDASFGTDQCPRCGFGAPWWDRRNEICTVCDTAFDLDWLPERLGRELERREFETAGTTAAQLRTAIDAAKAVLVKHERDQWPEDITALMGPAEAAHRSALARLAVVEAMPELTAATKAATDAVLAAVTHGADVAGWLAEVLAGAAAQLGSAEALTAARPGSWEADLVHRLVAGTVGWDEAGSGLCPWCGQPSHNAADCEVYKADCQDGGAR